MYRRLQHHLAVRAFCSLPREVRPPFVKYRTPTSVLEALSRATGAAVLDPISARDVLLQSNDTATAEYTEALRGKGQEAAQFFLKRDANIFSKFRFAQPEPRGLQPTYTAENVGEDSEDAVDKLVAALEASAAHSMFLRLTDDGAKPEAVSSAVRQRLLQLLAADVGSLSFRTSPFNWCQVSGMHDRSARQWNPKGPAEQLFATLEDEARNAPAYEAMIRGAASGSGQQRALQLYTEMRERNLAPNLETWNAVLSAAASSEDGAWKAVLRVYQDLLTAGLAPSIQTFNAILRAFLQQEDIGQSSVMAVIREIRLRDVRPNIGTVSALLALILKRNLVIYEETRHLLEELMASPARIEYSQLQDMDLTSNVWRAMPLMHQPLLATCARLFGHSPNLWPNRQAAASFLSRLFSRLERSDPAAALQFYKDHMAHSNDLYPVSKLKCLAVFMKLEPDAVDRVLMETLQQKAALLFGPKPENFLPDLQLAYHVLQLQPLSQNAVFRSVQHFWTFHRSSITTLPPRHSAVLLAICLPHPRLMNLEERICLGWDIFQITSSTNVWTHGYHLLLLADSLRKGGRLQDAAKVLNRFVRSKEVFEVEPRIEEMKLLFQDLLSAEEFTNFLRKSGDSLLEEAQAWPRMKRIQTMKPVTSFAFGKQTIDLAGHKPQRRRLSEKTHSDPFERISREEARSLFSEGN